MRVPAPSSVRRLSFTRSTRRSRSSTTRDPVRRARSGGQPARFGGSGLRIVFAIETSSVVGVDRGIYRDAAQRWVGGGFFYYPEQIGGPYEIVQGHILYPPVALAWLVPSAYLPEATASSSGRSIAIVAWIPDESVEIILPPGTRATYLA